ncbi:hypothetical protein [Methanonatronarchaeum sp. AMET-Sl]|uniref:hypothetical protein n=1 Tax=Methanonatronarchaeum sp. AMET-Sl TaxID=3037654 RepID=UPI00244DA049|nr:hypothetical protein [Methanonatronarchaeum sp. AMET-Sl]WGI17165.1 hypothetical protein QEN48_06595 [Methanonatronarchaeum sp. AMET-Sl]
MVKISNDRVPLPNNPYKIYKVQVGGRTYPRTPFPRYISLMLGLDPESIADKYNLEIYVNREKKIVELNLIEKN